MKHAARGLALAGIGDGDPLAVLTNQHPAIAGLAASEGIEDRPIELDPALANRDDTRRGALEIGIVPEQKLGMQRLCSFYSCASACPGWYCRSMWPWSCEA